MKSEYDKSLAEIMTNAFPLREVFSLYGLGTPYLVFDRMDRLELTCDKPCDSLLMGRIATYLSDVYKVKVDFVEPRDYLEKVSIEGDPGSMLDFKKIFFRYREPTFHERFTIDKVKADIEERRSKILEISGSNSGRVEVK